MVDREITFKLRAISDISDVTKNVQALREYFKQLKMPSDTFKGFDNTFTQLEKKVESVQAKLQAGFKTSSDVNSFKRELADIRQLYASLARDIKGIDIGEVFKGVDSPELTKAKQNLKDFEDALKDLQNINLKNINEKFGISGVENLSKARQEVEGLKTALTQGNFDQAARQARDLAKAVNSMKEGNRATAYRSLLEQLGLGKDETGKVITDINKIREALSQAFNGEALDNAKTGIEATRIQIENLSTAQVEDLIKQFEELGLVIRTGATQEMPRMQRGLDDTVESSKHLNSELDQFKNRIAYFFGMNNAVRLFQRALRSAYDTVRDLDKVMTETAVVTDFSVSDMWAQLPEYTARANELGVTIHDVYEASTLYYQQGLKTNEVMAVTNATLRMARIAGLDAAEATDRVTNALRGFNMEITEANANNIADVYSKLAAISASNVDEISTAMTKTASLASSANMEFETTAAFLAQIIETTRESAETAGTALKTVIARFSEVKKLYSEGELLGTDTEGEEIDVNKVSTALRTAGINLNEFLTGSKGLDEVFMELASKWDSLTIVQQRYIATMAAGSRQQSRFIALMSDYARTQELVGAAQNATGASQEQYEKTLDSLETKLNQLKNAWDEFVMGLAKDEAIKWVVDSLTSLLGAVNKLTANLPGLLKTLSRIGIAFGAFKGTSAIFNGLLRAAGAQIAKGAGKDLTEAGEKGAGLFAGGFSGAWQKLWPQTNQRVLDDLATLSEAGAFPNDIDDSFTQSIYEAYLARDYTSVQESLKGIQVEGEKAQQALARLNNLKAERLNNSLQQVGTAATAAGGALLTLTSILSMTGAISENTSKVLTIIGMSLVGIGQILPILAKGITALGTALHLSTGGATLLIAGIIAGLVAIIALINEAGRATREAQKNLEEAEDRVEKITENYETLNSSIQEIVDSEKELDQLIVSTSKWTDEVAKLNQQYLDLIEKIPALAPFLSTSNGHLFIDFEEAGVQDVINQMQKGVIEAQINELYARRRVAEVGSVTAPIELAGINTTSGYMMTSEYAKQVAEALRPYITGRQSLEIGEDQTVLDAYNSLLGNLGFENVQLDQTGLDNIREYITALEQEANLINGYNNAINTLTAASVEGGEKYRDAMSAWLAATQAGREQENFVSENMINEVNAPVWKEWNEFLQNYADQMGYTLDPHKIGAGEATFQTPTGAQQFELLDEFNAYRTQNAAAGFLKNTMDQILAWEPDSDDAKALKKALLDPYILTQADIDQLWSNGELRNGIYNALSGELQDAFSPQQLTDYFSEIFSQFEKVDTDYIDNIFTGAHSINQQGERKTIEAVTSVLTNAVNSSGIGVARSMSGLFHEVFLAAGENGDKLVRHLIEITSDTNIDDFISEMESLGLIAPGASDKVRQLATEIQRIARVDIPSLNDLKEQVTTDAKLLQSITERNATDRSFTEDEMTRLIEINPDLLSQFTYNPYTEEWEYLGSDLNNLAEMVRANTEAVASNTIAQLEEQVKAGEQWEKVIGNFTEEQIKLARSEDLSNPATEARQEILRAVGYGDAELEGLKPNQLQQLFIQAYQSYDQLNSNRTDLARFQAITGMIQTSTGTQVDNTQGAIQAARRGDVASTQGIVSEASRWGVALEEIEEYNKLMEHADSLTVAERDHAAELIRTISEKAKLAQAGKNMENYGKAIGETIKQLSELDESSEDYSEAINRMEQDTEQYLNLDLPDNFLRQGDNLQLLQDALSGNDAAWEQFQKNAMVAAASMTDFVNKYGLDADEISNITSAMDNLEFDVNGTADVTQLINAFLEAGGQAEEVGDYLESLSLSNIEFESQTNGAQLADMIEGGKLKTTVRATHVNLPARKGFTSGGGGGGSGGGGGGGSSKKQAWKNPYDELYNLTEQINEALRTRNKIEDEYDRLLKRRDGDTEALYKNSLKEIDNLQKEIQLQKQLRAGRLSQLGNVANEKFETSEGEFKSYAEMNVVQYASYDPDSGLLQIDWNGIDAISDTETGKAVEAYVKRLEELQGQIEDTDDTINEMEDTLYEIQERGKKEALDMEERIANALYNAQQKIIDDYKELSDTISNSNDRVLSSLQDSIDLSRQIRDNTKTESDIAKKESRLAYLRRDTSGANELEARQLEQELADARESYGDTLIDQSLDQLNKDNEQAREQRERQIEIMQSQLDYQKETGVFAREAEAMLIEAVNTASWNAIEELLKKDEGFEYLSTFAQEQWLADLEAAEQTATDGVNAFLGKKVAEIIDAIGNAATRVNSGISQASSSSGSGSGGSSGGGTPSSSGDVSRTNPNTTRDNAYTQGSSYISVEEQQAEQRRADFAKARKNYQAVQNTPMAEEKLKVIIDELNRKWGLKLNNTSVSSLYAYKTGGLADFTGPAWLDGTKSHPELVLNAKDTENFIALRNILSHLMNGQVGGTGAGTYGDINLDIDVNVDQISNDYDVDQLIDRVKQNIYQDASYRNIHQINFIR